MRARPARSSPRWRRRRRPSSSAPRYHADYATLLAAPADLAGRRRRRRRGARRRRGDPADHPDPLGRRRPPPPALRRPGRRRARPRRSSANSPGPGWTVNREREDVCPVADAAGGHHVRRPTSATLGKKERHEIRRKVRRAEAAGEVRLDASAGPGGRPGRVHRPPPARWGADGLFPPTPGGGAEPGLLPAALRAAAGRTAPSRLRFLTVGGRRIAAGVWFDDGETLFFYNAGVDPEARELSPGRPPGRALRPGARSRPVVAGSTSCAATRPTSTSGAPWTSQSSACSSRERWPEMGAPLPDDPCVGAGEPAAGSRRPRPCASWRSWRPAPTAAPRSTSTRSSRGMDRVPLRRRPWSRSRTAAPIRKHRRAWASRSSSSTSPTTRSPSARVAAHLADVRPDVVHNHMYRAELVGTRAAIALGEAGHRRPYVVGTVHSSRVRSPEDRGRSRRLTPQMDHLIAVSRAIVAEDRRRAAATGRRSRSSTTAWTS